MKKTYNVINELRDVFCKNKNNKSNLNVWEKQTLFHTMLAYLNPNGADLLNLMKLSARTITDIVRYCLKHGKPESICTAAETKIQENVVPASVCLYYQNECKLFKDIIHDSDIMVFQYTGCTVNIPDISALEEILKTYKENPVIGYMPVISERYARKVRFQDVSYFVIPSRKRISKSEFMHMAVCAEDMICAVAVCMFLKDLKERYMDEGRIIRQIIDLYQIGVYEKDSSLIDAARMIMAGFTAGFLSSNEEYRCPDIHHAFHAIQHMESGNLYTLKSGCRWKKKIIINIDNYEVSYAA